MQIAVSFDASNHFDQQRRAAEILDKFNIDGTFFYSQYLKDTPSEQELMSLFERGHEIGGQTLNYVELDEISSATAIDEICLNRKHLLKEKLEPRTFAYPFGEYTYVASVFAKDCGYNQAIWFEQDTVFDESVVNVTNKYKVQAVSLEKRRTFEEIRDIAVSFNDLTILENEPRLLVLHIVGMCDNCFEAGTEYVILERFLEWANDQGARFTTINLYFGGNTSVLPNEYIDPPPGRLLPETKSKLIVSMTTVGAMIVLIIVFFASSSIRDWYRKR